MVGLLRRTRTWFAHNVAVSNGLIAINVVLFIVGLLMGNRLTAAGQSLNILIVEAATLGPAIDVLDEWWRVFTGGFLHHDLLHLALNMYVLFFLGWALEKSLGRVPFIAVYLSSLVAGSFGALLETPNALVVGASGAIFGLLGAYTALSLSRGVGLFQTSLGLMLIINLGIGIFHKSISLGGHIGRFVGGFIVGMATTQAMRREYHPTVICLVTAVVVGTVSFVGALWAATLWT